MALNGGRYLGAGRHSFRRIRRRTFRACPRRGPGSAAFRCDGVELSFVVEGRKGETGRSDLELLLRDGAFDVIAVTQQQAEIAIEAFRRFGRGRHPAALNIGDCFSYALAVATDDSLLFKGDNFAQTDIRPL